MKSPPSLTKYSRAFNRQSVQAAIKSLQTYLKKFKTIPDSGIALFAGVQPVSSDDRSDPNAASSSTSNGDKERLMVKEVIPLKPLVSGTYHCDAKFDISILEAQLQDETTFGFVLIDGSGCGMYTVSGDSYHLLWKHGDPALPKKHGRGGQSAPRFGRLRTEKRAAWVSLVAKQMNTIFIDKASGLVNVAKIILCGTGELKQHLYDRNTVLDNRIVSAIHPTLIDLQYAGQAGIQEAIKRSGDLTSDHTISIQRGVLVSFMENIAKDVSSVTFGATDTMFALEAGAVDTLIVSDSLAAWRVTYRNKITQESVSEYNATENYPLTPSMIHRGVAGEVGLASVSPAPSTEWFVEFAEPLIDYLVVNVASFGAKVQLVSPVSAQGAQFANAFGGLGSILRWQIELPSAQPEEMEDSEGEYDFSVF